MHTRVFQERHFHCICSVANGFIFKILMHPLHSPKLTLCEVLFPQILGTTVMRTGPRGFRDSCNIPPLNDDFMAAVKETMGLALLDQG